MLEFQADRIEHVLAAHRVQARVEGGTVTDAGIRFQLSPSLGARIARVRGLREELALALGADQVHIEREGGRLSVEIPHSGGEPVHLLPLMESLGKLPPLTAALGISADGRPLLIRLSAPEAAHVLVAGATGSGKTELLRTIILSLAFSNRQSDVQLALIDPKYRGMAPLSALPHLIEPVASSPTDIVELLRRLVREMEGRDSQEAFRPHILIAVDELLEIFSTTVGAKVAGPLLARIASRGREAGLHLVAGAQRPSVSDIGGLLKANFPVRLVGRVVSPEDARVAAGIGGTGAETLAGRGDFLAVASGQVTRFRAALAPKEWPAL